MKTDNVDFSVITVCYNAASTISETIESVLQQTDICFEYIIMDGCSTDDTVELLNNVTDPRVKFISEKDNGLYDAMNKAISLASGKYIAIINADDIYVDEFVLSSVKQEFERSLADIVSGHLYYFDTDFSKKARRYRCSPLSNRAKWGLGWQPPHPSTYVKKEVYDSIGLYCPSYKISADYEFLLRALFVNKYKHSVIDQDLVAMRLGGESTAGVKSIYLGNKEVLDAWKRNGKKAPFYLVFIKLFNKLFSGGLL
ncbi:glycosyltransferase [Shewanella canadensis]|uniref:Glycosyltransferase n=1 Tax=Shewanella canadensis TaxID=271096 RepID=A0A3S0LHZ6_9GAMM|nr:glycosyltransferase family 2 protein [Shewanella canadensis]RTR35956.1 glycosyltransferase [Shewanella canadensis]